MYCFFCVIFDKCVVFVHFHEIFHSNTNLYESINTYQLQESWRTCEWLSSSLWDFTTRNSDEVVCKFHLKLGILLDNFLCRGMKSPTSLNCLCLKNTVLSIENAKKNIETISNRWTKSPPTATSNDRMKLHFFFFSIERQCWGNENLCDKKIGSNQNTHRKQIRNGCDPN